MTEAERFPFVEVHGAAHARGHAYGTAFRERIRATWRFYVGTVFASSNLSVPQIAQRAARVRELIFDFNAEYCTEIEAVAAASGLANWEVYALNARTEILNAEVGECTAVFLPESRVLGQTWDWIEALEALVAVTRYVRDDGHRIVTLAEPGQLAKIGMNSAGIGVCLNFLAAPHALEGVPVHVLIRAILDCRGMDEVRQVIARAGYGKASHFLIADDRGEVLSIEFEGTGSALVEPVDGIYAHTNHCIAATRGAKRYVIPTSAERLVAAHKLASRQRRGGVRELQRILDFDDGTPAAVRVRYRPEPLLGGSKIGSCATIIMDLPARTMHLKKGPVADGAYTNIAV
ncbi:MAG: hypothetical protein HYX63_18895 [Gammaproteobacteria bacterium]|nr:hypothetical protein [Gammaproteobacteria bacterium]